LARTDPARELASTLEQLTNHPDPNASVDTAIAGLARVDGWSSEFFLVLFELIRRCEIVEVEIRRLPLDEDVKTDSVRSIHRMKTYLNQKQIVNQKIAQAKSSLGGQNITILKMLSSQVRENISYEHLIPEQRDELLADVRALIGWLHQQQDQDTDFIRQALIEGLQSFEFRLDRLSWFGAGYVIDGLKDVLHAYLALQGAIPEVSNGDELITAMLMKTKAFMGKAVKAFNFAKGASEDTGWVLQAYGAASALHDGSETISGLLGG
jgi:hypothetical protein